MNRRPGITLIEVLVAIFIMAIGMIALLTLFPLGAINIAQALRDDRATQSATNASAYANAQDLRHDANVSAQFAAYMSVANSYDPNGPSPPIYVDPYYFPIAGKLGGSIDRVTPSYTGSASAIDAWFSLLDDLSFDLNGTSTTTGAGNATTVQRTGRYTWAYMLRRPRLGDERVVDMSVVVYADRSTQTPLGETQVSNVTGTPGSSTLTFSYTAATKPRIRNGSWIMDVTSDQYTWMPPNAVTTAKYLVPRGYFYRVVDASEDASDTQFTLELKSPIRAAPAGGSPAALPLSPSPNMTIVVLENVIEVFDRGNGFTP